MAYRNNYGRTRLDNAQLPILAGGRDQRAVPVDGQRVHHVRVTTDGLQDLTVARHIPDVELYI